MDNLHQEIQNKVTFFRREYIASLGFALLIFGIGAYFMWESLVYFMAKQPGDDAQKMSNADKYLYLVSKVTLVVFLELTCFFLFKHANKTLNFLQFMNNEMTGIKFKKLAFITAIASEDLTMVRNVVSEFVKTDRNYPQVEEKDANLSEATKHATDLLLKIAKDIKN